MPPLMLNFAERCGHRSLRGKEVSKMKKMRLLSLCLLAGLLLTGCKAVPVLKGEFTVGTDIRQEDISEFYYTYENINFNASYLRYRFYTEDGGYYFYHERRERPDDYGPTTEEDVVSRGTVKLTEAQWGEFFDLLKDGTVVKRGESAESGSRGPWLYLYWTGDKSQYQQFSFDSVSTRRTFEEFCAGLVQQS